MTNFVDPQTRNQNGTVWIDGKIEPWSVARIPLMSDSILRSTNVFDGVKVTVLSTGEVLGLGTVAHIERLRKSCRVLGISIEYSNDQIESAFKQVAVEEAAKSECQDVYIRPMVVGANLTGRASKYSLTVAGFGQERKCVSPVSLQVSHFRRPRGDSIPAQVKSVANYQLSRLARICAQASGFDDAIILNSAGRVAEAAGAALVVSVDGKFYTPPAYEDALPSVTVGIVASCLLEYGINLNYEPVSLAEMYGADFVVQVGTLDGIKPVLGIDHVSFDLRLFELSPLDLIRERLAYGKKGDKCWIEIENKSS